MTHGTPHLIARQTELAALEQHLLRGGGTGPVLVAVTGAPGVGKTALVQALVGRHDGPVLRARGASWETGLRYGVLAQLAPDGEGRPADAVAAAERVVRRVAAAGDGPVLLVVDDAHWADPASLQALSSLVRHHPGAAVRIVLVARESGHDVRSEVPELVTRSADHVLRLAPLGPRAVADLAESRGIALQSAMAVRLARHTAGLPRQVLALLDEMPPDAWERLDLDLPAPTAVAARVRDLIAAGTAEATALVEAVAVLGSPASLAEVSALAGLTDPLPALTEAQQVDLVRAPGHRGSVEVDLVDPMVAAAVLATLGPQRAAQAHRRAASVVVDPARRLGHLVAATPLPDPALADELATLADRCAAEGAWGVAASLLADASRLTDDVNLREERLTRAADALVGAGDGLGAAALVPAVESLRETPQRNAVLGYLAIIRGRLGEAETRLGRAWSLVNTERDPGVAASICQRFVLHALSRCRGEELVTWADRAVALAGPDTPAGVEAQAIRGLGLAGMGRPARALAEYTTLVREVGDGAQGQRVRMGRGWLLLAQDDVDAARSELESAVPTDALGGSDRISLWARAWLARAQFVAGDWEPALHTVREALALADRSGMVLASPLLHWTATQVHVLRGDWEPAGKSLSASETGAADYEIMRVPSCLARAAYAEAEADYDGVLRALTPLTQSWAGRSIDEPGFWPWPDVYASALVMEGRLDEADAFLLPHVRRAEERGHRSAQARLGIGLGRLQGARGQLDDARATFEQSLRLLEGLPLRYDRARVNFAFGQTLRRAGKRREADAVISTARDIHLALGATTYVRRCDRELKAGGLHAVRTDRGLSGLTPQEEAVSGLVATGLTNREVAAELFLSVKTVQYHLTRVYAKLGIRSRSELAAVRGPSSGADSS